MHAAGGDRGELCVAVFHRVQVTHEAIDVVGLVDGEVELLFIGLLSRNINIKLDAGLHFLLRLR